MSKYSEKYSALGKVFKNVCCHSKKVNNLKNYYDKKYF